MKLLTPNEIREKKNEEDRLAFSQGSQLAKKVDSLRVMSVEEEKKLEEIRTEMTAVVKSEIETMNGILVGLKGEISDLSKQRTLLMEPLTKEWADLKKEKSSFVDKVVDLEHERAVVLQMKTDLQRNLDYVEDIKDQATERLNQAQKLYQERTLQQKELRRLTNQVMGDIELLNQRIAREDSIRNEKDRRLTIREKELDIKIANFNKTHNESKYAVSRR